MALYFSKSKRVIKRNVQNSVSYREPSGMEQNENLGKISLSPNLFCLYHILHWIMFIWMNLSFPWWTIDFPTDPFPSVILEVSKKMKPHSNNSAWLGWHCDADIATIWPVLGVAAAEMVHLLVTFWPELQIRTLEKPYQLLRNYLQLY